MVGFQNALYHDYALSKLNTGKMKYGFPDFTRKGARGVLILKNSDSPYKIS